MQNFHEHSTINPRVYLCQGLDKQGKQTCRLLSIIDPVEISSLISLKNIRIISIKRIYKHRISALRKHLISLLQQLHLLLKSNIPLRQALQTLSSTQHNLLFSAIITEIYNSVSEGHSLASAMEKFPTLFSPLVLTYVKNGETTGKLECCLNKLTLLLAKQRTLRLHLKKSMRYPLFLLTTCFLTCLAIVIFILPNYQLFFAELGQTLPWQTQLLLNTTQWLKNNYLLLSLVICLSLLLLRFAVNASMPSVHWLALKLPLMRGLTLSYNLSQWCFQLSIAYETGIPLITAIKLANGVLQNSQLKTTFSKLNSLLISGYSLHDSLAKICFPSLIFLHLIRIGETSGTLGEVFSKIATEFETKLTQHLQTLAKSAEPTLLILLALLAGFVITALYLPMLTLGLNG